MMMMLSTEPPTGDHPLPHPDHPNLEEKEKNDDDVAAATSSSSSLVVMDTHRYSSSLTTTMTTSTVLTIDVGCLNEEDKQEIPPKASSPPLPDQLPFDNCECNSNSHNHQPSRQQRQQQQSSSLPSPSSCLSSSNEENHAITQPQMTTIPNSLVIPSPNNTLTSDDSLISSQSSSLQNGDSNSLVIVGHHHQNSAFNSFNSFPNGSGNKPFRSFKSSEEYLIAMKEDLSEWLNSMYFDGGVDEITVDSFMSSLETGVILCRHANNVIQRAKELKESGVFDVPDFFLSPNAFARSGGERASLSSSRPSLTSSTASVNGGVGGGKLQSNPIQLPNCHNNHLLTQQQPTSSTKSKSGDVVVSTAAITTTTKPLSQSQSKQEKKVVGVVSSTNDRRQQQSLPATNSTTKGVRRSSLTSLSSSSSSSQPSRISRIPTTSSSSKNNVSSTLGQRGDINGGRRQRSQQRSHPMSSTMIRSSSVTSTSACPPRNVSSTSSSRSGSRRNSLKEEQEEEETTTHKSNGGNDLIQQQQHQQMVIPPFRKLSLRLNSHHHNRNGSSREGGGKATTPDDFKPRENNNNNNWKKSTSLGDFKRLINQQPHNSSNLTHQAINSGPSSSSLSNGQQVFFIPYRSTAQPGSFQARDNVCNFITWCRDSLGIRECLLFETEDLVLAKNEKSFILCLLEVARKGALIGMKVPLLVQLEQEIDREIERDSHQMKKMTMRGDRKNLSREKNNNYDSQYNSEEEESSWCDSHSSSNNLMMGVDEEEEEVEYGPQQQIVTNDLRSLHEHVVELLNRCTCPSQYPMIKVADGKYRIGDTKTLIFVRILRKHVMVRVGGGWDTLEHYLDKHDPCRCYYSTSGHSSFIRGGRRSSTTSLSTSNAVGLNSPSSLSPVISSMSSSKSSSSSSNSQVTHEPTFTIIRNQAPRQ